MYATTTVPHFEPKDLLDKVRPGYGRVNCHLGDLYLSMTPDEAESFARALQVAAREARTIAA